MTDIDLVGFLRDRLDEDEQSARAATPGPWTLYDTAYPETIYGDGDKTAVVAGGRWGGEASVFESTADAIHIARHDPARVLAETDAKRRIIDWHPLTDQIINPGYGKRVADFGCTACHDWDGVTEGRGYCQTLRLLALPYAGHSSYQSDWAPDA